MAEEIEEGLSQEEAAAQLAEGESIEEGLNNTKSIGQRVEESLREKQAKKLFKDTQRRVGGTRKEQAAYRKLTSITIDDLNKLEVGNMAYDIIKKEKVWPAYNIEGEREKGVSSGTAFLKKKLRESYPAQPANNAAARKVYVGMANALQVLFADVKTYDQFKAAASVFYDRVPYYSFSSLIDPTPEMFSAFEDEMKESEIAYDIADKKYSKLLEERNNTPMDERNTEAYEKLRERVDEANKEMRRLDNFTNFPESLFNSINGFAETKQGDFKTLTLSDINPWRLLSDFNPKFYNFIKESGTSARDNYVKAKLEYDEITKAKSEEYVDRAAKSDIDRFLDYKEKINLYANPAINPARFQELIQTENRWCYNMRYRMPNYLNKVMRGTDTKCMVYRDIDTKILDREAKKAVKDDFHEWIQGVISRKLPEMEANIKAVRDKYKQHEEDWSWAFGEKGGKKGAKKKGKLDVFGKPLSFIKRINGLKVTEADVTVDNIQKIFGFKAVELGTYIEDNFARESIRHFLGAMSDLGEVMNMDVSTLNSLNKYGELGGLSMWFGAAGAGKAMAYFKPSKVVINLTKKRGQGTVCHEYGHYLDSCMSFVDRGKVNIYYGSNLSNHYVVQSNAVYMASDMLKGGKKKYYTSIQIDKGNVGNTAVGTKMYDINNYIQNNRYPEYLKQQGKYKAPEGDQANVLVMEFADANPKKSYSSYRWNSTSYKREDGETDDAYISRLTDYNNIKFGTNGITSKEVDIIKSLMKLNDVKNASVSIKMELNSTKYALYSRDEGEYWSRPVELFARAFEVYIERKLEDAGMYNNYLVSGAFDNPVYPQGAEKENLFYLYEELFKTFKEEYKVPDFVPFTTERETTFIELDSKEPEEQVEKKGIAVDPETEEVEQLIGNSNTSHHKFAMLVDILTNELNVKMEDGGYMENYNKLLTFVHSNR